ncbi:MAG TPA: hypothetical protein VI451_21955, partial [Anaerolineales bacterium]|nr:hypothetical protein [Anaerolineales bacterium]
DISVHAATRKSDYSAEMYIYESIVSPNVYVVEGFQGGIMPQKFSEIFTQQDLANLVAYLMTIR